MAETSKISIANQFAQKPEAVVDLTGHERGEITVRIPGEALSPADAIEVGARAVTGTEIRGGTDSLLDNGDNVVARFDETGAPSQATVHVRLGNPGGERAA